MSTSASDMQAMLLTKPVTQIHGCPEIDEIDTLEKEVAHIVAQAKMFLFTQSRKYGHLAMIVGIVVYRNTIGEQTCVYITPTELVAATVHSLISSASFMTT
jgi:hypothetical protein